MDMVEGIIIKAFGGFYYAYDGSILWECTLRGVFRHKNIDVMVGDRVFLQPVDHGRGVVEEVLPRHNALVRPAVANVDRVLLVFAVKRPDPSLVLLDRMLVQTAVIGIPSVICFNKTDLLEGPGFEAPGIYRDAGYTVIETSAREGDGIYRLKELLSEGLTVLAGPSGVGKSSLLNAVSPELSLKTDEISHRLERGKHTTRQVVLMALGSGGLVADTPGFSSLHLPHMDHLLLGQYYPEIEKYGGCCRFSGCSHWKEPGCEVKEAVTAGKIDSGRYSRYTTFLEELLKQERKK